MLLNWCLDDSLSIRELEFKPGFAAKIARRPEVLEVNLNFLEGTALGTW
jgi:hypothetical protein